jgi:hypothetical protein
MLKWIMQEQVSAEHFFRETLEWMPRKGGMSTAHPINRYDKSKCRDSSRGLNMKRMPIEGGDSVRNTPIARSHDDGERLHSRKAVTPTADFGDSPRLVAQRAAMLRLQQNPRAAAQRKQVDSALGPSAQRTSGIHQTGIPSGLQAVVEARSGMDLSAVQVHRNSGKPQQQGALAYAQGNDIHLGPGQDQHLPHELWHVVQQRQGRVKPTIQTKTGLSINDDPALETEADAVAGEIKGTKANPSELTARKTANAVASPHHACDPLQLKLTDYDDFKSKGTGIDWDPHRTQSVKTEKTTGGRIARGLGVFVKDAGAIEVDWGGKQHAVVDSATGEPALLQWRLDPLAQPGVEAKPTNRTRTLAATAKGKKKKTYPYVPAQLVPFELGGDATADNVVAIPDKSTKAIDEVYERLFRLVLEQRAYVSFEAKVTHVDESKPTKVRYAKSIECNWYEVDPKGHSVPGTHASITITLPSPAEYAGGDKGKFDIPTTIGGLTGSANRANVTPNALTRDPTSAISWHTEIEFSSTTAEGDGQEVEARRLGPDHKMGEEPVSGGIWSKRVKQMEALSGKPKKRYVAGHLLNHQLGGPGNDARNLAPIPGDANTKFEKEVEKPVKKIVNVDHGWAYYKVSVDFAPLGGKSKGKYPSEFHAVWWQLDQKEQRVPNTKGDISMTMDSPKTGGDYQITTTKREAGSGARQGATAQSPLAFHEIVLDNDPAILRPKILIMRPLVASLKEMRLNDYFQGSDLSKCAETVLGSYTPQAAELQAYKVIVDFTAEAAGASSPMDIDRKRFAEAKDSVETAFRERDSRVSTALGAAKAFYKEHYENTRANDLINAVNEAAKQTQGELIKMMTLASRMISTAETLHKLAEENHDRLVEEANHFRQWLGLAPLDIGTTTVDDASAEIESSSKQVVSNVLYVHQAPGSPGQVITVSESEGISNAESSVDARDQLAGRYAEASLGLNKRVDFSSVPRARLDERLLTLLDDDTTRQDLIRASSTSTPSSSSNIVAETVQQLAKMVSLSKPQGLATELVAKAVIAKLYEEHTKAFQQYMEWAENVVSATRV